MSAGPTASIDSLITRYLADRCQSNVPISVTDAVNALRDEIPDGALQDEELAEMISIFAVQTGHPVYFDTDLLRLSWLRQKS